MGLLLLAIIVVLILAYGLITPNEPSRRGARDTGIRTTHQSSNVDRSGTNR